MNTIKIGDIVKVSPTYVDEYSHILWYEDFNADTVGTVRDIEPNGKMVLVRWDIDENACVDLDIQIENLILVSEPEFDLNSNLQFLPCWRRDNYGKYPHEGVVVPVGEDVAICQFVNNGYNINVCGCISNDNTIRIWAESSVRKEPFKVFDEEFYEELADAFDAIVMRLYDSGIDVQEVAWMCDWCESQSTVTGELGAGLFIRNFTEEHSFPYGCGFPGCNDLRRADKDFDPEFDFENEILEKDSDDGSKSVVINVYL